MSSLIHLALFLILPLAFAQEEEAKEEIEKIAVVKKGTFTATLELEGKFVPGKAVEFNFWPKAYSGALKVLDVKEPGSMVKEGDLLVRFDAEGIDDQIVNAQLDLRAAEQQLEDALNRMKLAEVERENELNVAAQELEFAELKLKGYRDVEIALRREEVALSRLFSEHSIEDQEDELEQLGKMYEEDELTEETEELVLKRSKRNLTRTKTGFDIQKRRRDYEKAFNEPVTLARMIRDVENRRRGLEKLKLTGDSRVVLAGIEAERTGLKYEKQQKKLADLEADRAIMEITSPAAGMVLHASRKLEGNLLKPGRTAGLYEPFLCVAEEGSLGIRFFVPEADLFKVKAGQAVVVKPTSDPKETMEAEISNLGSMPDAKNQWEGMAEVKGAIERFKPAMTCKLEVSWKMEDVIVVPKTAVHGKEGNSHCRVLVGDKKVMRSVVTGESNDEEVVINEGLEEGERILM